MEFVITGEPIGKPRMSRRDVWAQRPCVVAYRAWADKARAAAALALAVVPTPDTVELVAYLPIPPSWSRRKAAEAAGRRHRTKPDADNVAKAALDALFKHDQVVSDLRVQKRWDDGGGPRLEVTVA